ncbi:MAG: hypothetical protein ACI93T_002609, partial [Porticoccaceae bacterium]
MSREATAAYSSGEKPAKKDGTSRSRDRIVCLQFRDVLPVFCRAVVGIHNVMKIGAFEKAVEVIYAPVVLLVKGNIEPFSSIMKWYVDLFRVPNGQFALLNQRSQQRSERMSDEFPDKAAVDQLFESTTDVTARPTRQPKEYRFRWGWGLAILVLGVAAELLVWNVIGQDRTHQVFYSLPIVSGTPFFLLIWWAFFSGIDWGTRLLGVGAVASVVLLLYSQYRFDGFEGDMIPRFEKRSTPTSEAQLAKFVKTQQSQKPVAPEWAMADDQDWPEYRGPARDGVVRYVPADVDWSVTPNEVWRHAVGEGWSSFSIAEATLPSVNPDEPPQR